LAAASADDVYEVPYLEREGHSRHGDIALVAAPPASTGAPALAVDDIYEVPEPLTPAAAAGSVDRGESYADPDRPTAHTQSAALPVSLDVQDEGTRGTAEKNGESSSDYEMYDDNPSEQPAATMIAAVIVPVTADDMYEVPYLEREGHSQHGDIALVAAPPASTGAPTPAVDDVYEVPEPLAPAVDSSVDRGKSYADPDRPTVYALSAASPISANLYMDVQDEGKWEAAEENGESSSDYEMYDDILREQPNAVVVSPAASTDVYMEVEEAAANSRGHLSVVYETDRVETSAPQTEEQQQQAPTAAVSEPISGADRQQRVSCIS